MLKRFVVGLAAGYVLGTRAGEKRYAQITDWVEKARSTPGVQKATSQGEQIAKEHGGRVIEAIRSKLTGDPHEAGDSASIRSSIANFAAAALERGKVA